MIYCFVGTNSSVGDLGFTHVGQYAEFSDELFRDVILGGSAFIPTEDFDKLFDRGDVAKARDGFISDRFQEALSTARELVRSTRALLEAGLPPQIT